MTIAANMTKDCSPMSLIYSLKYCVLAFIIQLLIAWYFSYDNHSLDDFKDFSMLKTVIRLLCSLFLNIRFQGDLNSAFEVLIFLKRMKGHRKHVKGRLINIAVISMQIITMIATYLALMVNMGQTSAIGIIIKNYVGLQLLMGVDNMFASVLP